MHASSRLLVCGARCSQAAFYDGVRNIGYAGNIQQLWESLDEDGSGFITLEEFDPHTMRDYMEFRRSVSKC